MGYIICCIYFMLIIIENIVIILILIIIVTIINVCLYLQISSHSKRILATFRLLVSNVNTELGKKNLQLKLFHSINFGRSNCCHVDLLTPNSWNLFYYLISYLFFSSILHPFSSIFFFNVHFKNLRHIRNTLMKC